MTATISIDAAQLPAASYCPDIAKEIDREELLIEDLFAQHMERFQPLVDHEALSLSTWILDTIEAAPTVQIGFVAVNILLNRSPYIEITLHEWARRLRTTKKTLSHFLVTQRDKISLKASGIAKSKRCRTNLRHSQKFYNENRRNGKPGPRDNDKIGNYARTVREIAEKRAKASRGGDQKEGCAICDG